MLEITSETSFSLSEDIILQALPELDKYYAFNIKDGDHFRLNSTAYFVLDAIGKYVIYSALLNIFIDEFKLPGEVADNDLKEVLMFAIENKIILKEKIP